MIISSAFSKISNGQNCGEKKLRTEIRQNLRRKKKMKDADKKCGQKFKIS